MLTSPPESPSPPSVRLHRSATDRLCCGVCGGLAEYLAVDSSLVRVAFIVAALWGGVGVLLYIVLAFVLPVDAVATDSRLSVSAERTHVLAGLVLIVFGGLLLASNMGLAPWLSWSLFWPVTLILVGFALLLRQPRGGAPQH